MWFRCRDVAWPKVESGKRAETCGENGEKFEKERKEKGHASIYKIMKTKNEGGDFEIPAANQELFYSPFIFK